MKRISAILAIIFASLLFSQASFAYSASTPRSLPFIHNGNIYTHSLSYSNEAGTWNFYVTDGAMVKCSKANYDTTGYMGYTGAVSYIECNTTGTGGSFKYAYETFDLSDDLVDSYWDYTQSNSSVTTFLATNLLHYPFDSDQLAFSKDIYNVAGSSVIFSANYTNYFTMKLPLPGSKNWLLTVEVGGNQCGGGTDSYHTGSNYYSLDFDDISAQNGQESNVKIYAAASGEIDTYGYDGSGFGHWVKIDHGNGYKTLYGHMTAQSLITSGSVNQGDQLGVVGTTGNSSGTHLHFQVYYDGSSASTATEISRLSIEDLGMGDYVLGSPCTKYPSTNTP